MHFPYLFCVLFPRDCLACICYRYSQIFELIHIFKDHHHNDHQSVLPKGRSLTANSRTKAAVLLWMNRCGSFPLLSAPHSLFSIWTDLKRSEKIPGAPTWRWGEWFWLTGHSGLHLSSTQGLTISSISVFDQIRDPEIPVTLRPYLRIRF